MPDTNIDAKLEAFDARLRTVEGSMAATKALLDSAAADRKEMHAENKAALETNKDLIEKLQASINALTLSRSFEAGEEAQRKAFKASFMILLTSAISGGGLVALVEWLLGGHTHN